METQDKNYMENQTSPKPARDFSSNWSGRISGGLIVIAIGVVLLLRQMGADLPYWLISWPMLLIVIGLFLGVRHSFRGPAWIILMVVGTVFLIDRIDPSFEVKRFAVPVILIAIGLIIMLRPRYKHREKAWKKWEQWDNNYTSNDPQSQDDFIDSTNVFGGIKKNIISKNFRGGDITTFFGGSELNLTQADSTVGRIELDVTQMFGGTKLIVPPHWKIQSEDLVCIFGGVDDKRPIHADLTQDSGKILVLRGTCIFAGIDIKSY